MEKCRNMLIYVLVASTFRAMAASSNTSDRQIRTFLHHLNFRCPLSIPSSSTPFMVDGGSFEKFMSSGENNGFTAVLIYASWCPFSSIFYSRFSTLSSLYPQIKHLVIEQSSVMPSVFSRYGIHSVPSLLIVHPTMRMRYQGPKDLQSAISFYKRATGLDPVVNLVEDEMKNDLNLFQLWNGMSLKEKFSTEPYLLLSIVFVLTRASLYIFPGIASCIKALWVACVCHLTLGIFGGHVLHPIDIKRVWSKFNLFNTRNFHKGARNARVWAPSLA
ncbi:5'-adenylylsulfate reductase-like 5 [Primulina huaijiensis]|uniref:5'-adenylylsulfate reductase-like 5 n=1 Tax=Primulina huaijiensis TaxID=1492673 RepID=UPI003CC70CE6